MLRQATEEEEHLALICLILWGEKLGGDVAASFLPLFTNLPLMNKITRPSWTGLMSLLLSIASGRRNSAHRVASLRVHSTLSDVAESQV